jgi:hypothetical protein
MRTFIVAEIRKALGRLKGTFVLIAKAAFIALVNVAFWFLPLFLMGYFALKPILSGWTEPQPAGPASVTQSQPSAVPGGATTSSGKRLDLEACLRSVRSIIRDWQIWSR